MTLASSELSITYRKINELIPYARNARTHSKRQICQIADSIKAFGFNSPVLLSNGSAIVAGYGRVAAAKLLGIPEVPTIELSSLSEDQVFVREFVCPRDVQTVTPDVDKEHQGE